jgi:hypothetical protein
MLSDVEIPDDMDKGRRRSPLNSKTYCISLCATSDCHRKLDEFTLELAERSDRRIDKADFKDGCDTWTAPFVED